MAVFCGVRSICQFDRCAMVREVIELYAGTRPLSEGSRVRIGGETATVKYLGALEDGDGEPWLGVEWDEDGRGRHDGCARGRRYFTASRPDSASFVKVYKVDGAQTAAEAIRHCYGEGEDEASAALNRANIDEWKKKIRVPFIEMIGFDSVQQKQGTLNMLQEACISDRCIWTAGDLAALCPSLKILDISRNLLNDWNTVADIVRQLPKLSILDVSKNLMTVPLMEEDAVILSKHFRNLRKLVLTHGSLQWHHVEKIALMCPNLNEMILAYNRIGEITVPMQGTLSDTLTTLVLDGNPVNWNEIVKLGYLKNLTTLHVTGCKIKEIKFDDRFEGEKTELFKSLQVLYVKDNLINDWRSISELNKLKSLNKLFIAKNPLFAADDYDTCCQLIIARIGDLKELNGSELYREIRRGAEYDYLKKHGLQWKQLQNDQIKLIDFYLNHARFNALVKKYGLPDDNLLQNIGKSWAINSNLIELVLIDESSGKTVTKKLPSTMTVQKLSALARRLFMSSYSPQLYVIHTNDLNGDKMYLHLENEMKELKFYSVESADTIIVRW